MFEQWMYTFRGGLGICQLYQNMAACWRRNVIPEDQTETLIVSATNQRNCDRNLEKTEQSVIRERVSGQCFESPRRYYNCQLIFPVRAMQQGGGRVVITQGQEVTWWSDAGGKRSSMSPFTSAGLLHPSLESSHLQRLSIASGASQIYHLLTIVCGKVINPCSSPCRWPPQSSVSSIIRTGYGQRRRTKP